MNSANPRVWRRSVSVLRTIFGVVLCGAILLLQGCNQEVTKPSGAEVEPEGTVVISLETTFQGLLPDEFGINVPRDLPTSDLNEWGEEMLAEMVDPEVDEKELSASLTKLLPADVVERILRPEFVLRDSAHVRDSLWAREVAESVTTVAKSELDSVVDLFYFVVNTIHVVPATDSLPFGPFESALYGAGTAEDRAWAFATLLRQRRIPSMVFADPASAAEQKDSGAKNLIVGALLNDAVYLFDAGLGLPIVSPDEPATNGLVRRPATLKQLLDNPDVLAKMGNGEASPYSITHEQFVGMQPLIIGDSSVWSRRMEGLRNGQPVEVNSLVFEALVSCGPFEGLVEIVSEHLTKVHPESNVGVWLYPEQQREARESVDKDAGQSARLATLSDTFKVPQPIRVKLLTDEKISGQPKLEFSFGASWGTHRRGRIDQIMGRPEHAIPAYLKVQNWRTMPPSPDDEPVNASLKVRAEQQLPDELKARHLNAAEEAIIWRATCQLQKGAYSSAASDLESYLRQLQSRPSIYPGRFKNEASYLAGFALAMSGNSRRGAAFMRNVDPEDSRYDASQWLVNRWTAQPANAE